METEGITTRIHETAQRIDRCLRGRQMLGHESRGPELLLKDLLGCMDSLCHALERPRDAPAGTPAELPLPQIARGFLDLVEGLGGVCWQADRATARLLYVSRGCDAVWGYAATELYARPELLESGVHPEDRARLLRGDEAGLRCEPARDDRCRIVRPDGRLRHVRIRTLPLPDCDGEFSCVVGIAEDITAQQETEQQVQRDRSELRALAAELVLAEERERRRLAIDLHDGLQQALELARIKVGMLRRPAAAEAAEGLRQIEALLEQGLETLRSLTFELSPPVLHDL